ncbi:unnamed protein product [Lasius platythorax]|uniref:Uncharacterized protein n=1 Tax=Lasius platythorax TaxID=488582 RepID=A0AAV2NMP0_9HYME
MDGKYGRGESGGETSAAFRGIGVYDRLVGRLKGKLSRTVGDEWWKRNEERVEKSSSRYNCQLEIENLIYVKRYVPRARIIKLKIKVARDGAAQNRYRQRMGRRPPILDDFGEVTVSCLSLARVHPLTFPLTLSPGGVRHPRNFARVALNRGINQVGRAQNSEIQFRYGVRTVLSSSILRYDVNSAERLFAREKSTPNRLASLSALARS